GAFYPPTVLTDCTPDMLVMSEETFGPIAAVRMVPDFAGAVERADVSVSPRPSDRRRRMRRGVQRRAGRCTWSSTTMCRRAGRRLARRRRRRAGRSAPIVDYRYAPDDPAATTRAAGRTHDPHHLR
ncbi:aldehyde dehydrogenase family protein, partial [Mycobacterium interjectum]|uniref:aldehyde dehydrogenase family protein n=1 Tax=Mycobacterium interjectum TaxID=33895 RepID=UPI0021F3ACB9